MRSCSVGWDNKDTDSWDIAGCCDPGIRYSVMDIFYLENCLWDKVGDIISCVSVVAEKKGFCGIVVIIEFHYFVWIIADFIESDTVDF